MTTRKPNNYWKDFANVERELREVEKKLGHFPTQKELMEMGRSSLVFAIGNYHKGINAVRERFGLKNMVVMIPFCRTVEEGKKVLRELKKNGLERGRNGLKVYIMCEIPSNVILCKQFLEIFDGFSIGSNDLTQLIMGVDRDSELVSHVYDERNEAVKSMIKQAVDTANKMGKYSGFCGQAPSDYPEMAKFLSDINIASISLNPDTVIKTLLYISEHEKKRKKISK